MKPAALRPSLGVDVTVDVRRLHFAYRRGTAAAVDGMDFGIAAGEIFGFLGPSGAGKSTTQRILIGSLRGWEGEIHVLGRDLRSWGAQYYERIGVAFEVPAAWRKLTARENLQTFASLYRFGSTEDPDALLAAVGLAEAADLRVSDFSKGMQVRLEVARSLLNRPDLLFLDEPTSGLDPVNARRVVELVAERRRQGVTVFLTTHDMTLAEALCDRVAFVVDGRIVASGSPRDLRLAGRRAQIRVEARDRDGKVEVRTFPLESAADNPQFVALLRSGAVETVHTMEPTLDDVFVQVTGRRLR